MDPFRPPANGAARALLQVSVRGTHLPLSNALLETKQV